MAKSVTFTFRLHPEHQREGRAIEVFKEYEKMGYSTRQVVTDAVLRLSGHTPEMFDNQNPNYISMDGLMKMFESRMSAMLEEFGKELLANRGSVSGRPVVEDDDEETDDVFVRNMAQAWAKRSGGK